VSDLKHIQVHLNGIIIQILKVHIDLETEAYPQAVLRAERWWKCSFH
jgi:hypothetical protein